MRFKGTQLPLPAIDMTPMIDVVFQLIIFFMLVNSFEQSQADERVKLPRDELAKPPEVVRENEMTLNVGFERDDRGNKLSGPVVFYAPEEHAIPVLNMQRILNREARLYSDVKTNPATVTIVIRADADVPTGLIQELIRMAQEAGFEKFAMKATEKIEP